MESKTEKYAAGEKISRGCDADRPGNPAKNVTVE
jgi:hypothetical protein